MYRFMMSLLLILVVSESVAQSDLLQEYLDIQHQRLNFNGVVQITKNNEPLYKISVGKASQELNVPVTDTAIFRVASVTKQFTAMLIAIALQENKAQLTDSLALFFPALNDTQWKRITLHHLLSHTSGIPHNEGIGDYWTIKSKLALSQQQALTEIFSMKLLFAPGTDMKYSSPGYFLLAGILEKVYKRSYAEILQEKILLPLNMKNTGVYISGKVIAGMVPGYHLLNDSLIKAPYRNYSLMKGSGDLYSSAEDLSKWNNSFSGNTIWNNQLKELVFGIHSPQSPLYGYGWFYRPGKRNAWYHGGGSFGSSSLSAWYPDEKMSVVILSNVSVLPVNELWNDIEKILFNEPFELPEINQRIGMNAEVLQRFTGKYVLNQQELWITLINNQLYAQLGSNPPFEIYPENSLTFFSKKVNIKLIFKTDAEGNILGVETEGRGQVHYFKKQ